MKERPFNYEEKLPHSKPSDFDADTSIPPSVDWRTKGVVPPVQNQGQCGGAGSFVIVDAIDSFHAIQTGHLVLGSREEFVDCCCKPPFCNIYICDGGVYDPIAGYKCVVDIGGLAGEEYHSPNGSCLNDTYKPVIKIDGGKVVTPARDEKALAAAVAMQPVTAAIDASHESFQFYSSGIYDEPDCSSTRMDHAVLIVGYGSLDGKDYWIVQNSWGERMKVLLVFGGCVVNRRLCPFPALCNWGLNTMHLTFTLALI